MYPPPPQIIHKRWFLPSAPTRDYYGLQGPQASSDSPILCSCLKNENNGTTVRQNSYIDLPEVTFLSGSVSPNVSRVSVVCNLFLR